MASNGTLRLSPVNFSSKNSHDKNDDNSEVQEDEKHSVLPGALLSPAECFRSKTGKLVTLTPVIVDFRRLLQCKSSVPVIAGIPNRELLHGVVALYDVSLGEMTPDVLYATVCEENARTIVLVKSVSEILDEIDQKPVADDSPDKITEDLVKEIEKDIEESSDIYTPAEDPPPVFAEVYSDTDVPDKEESEEEEEEEDYSKGMHTFIDKVKARRKVKTFKDFKESQRKSSLIGAESRIVAAATYEKTFVKSGSERIVHLTLIATRKRYRKNGIGKYLLNQIKSPSVVGQYDAVVVHADNSALEFFDRYGFTDDIILNSRWSELAEQFTNCTLMCYLPPFTGQTLLNDSIPELDILNMEKEIKKWRDKSIDSYRAEISCMNRLRNEMIHLRALVASQQDLIATLASENQTIRREKFSIEREFLEYKILTAKTTFHSDESEEDDDSEVNELIKKLEEEASLKKLDVGKKSYSHRTSLSEGKRKYMFSKGDGSDEPYDHGKDTEDFFQVSHDFYETMRLDHNITTAYEVKLVTKAILATSQEEAYQLHIKTLKDPCMCTRLYYCGSLEKANRIPDILKKGFTEEDFSHGDYGIGLYFSKLPSKAAQFSALGKLILAEVAIGNTETVIEKQRTRKMPSSGYDSIITPGRLIPKGDSESQDCQEYVLFDVHQVRPLYLIEYSPIALKN